MQRRVYEVIGSQTVWDVKGAVLLKKSGQRTTAENESHPHSLTICGRSRNYEADEKETH